MHRVPNLDGPGPGHHAIIGFRGTGFPLPGCVGSSVRLAQGSVCSGLASCQWSLRAHFYGRLWLVLLGDFSRWGGVIVVLLGFSSSGEEGPLALWCPSLLHVCFMSYVAGLFLATPSIRHLHGETLWIQVRSDTGVDRDVQTSNPRNTLSWLLLSNIYCLRLLLHMLVVSMVSVLCLVPSFQLTFWNF